MSKRAAIGNLLLSLVAFSAFMIVVLAAVGFGVGIPELTVGLAMVVVGIAAIIGRHRRARASAAV